MNKIPNYFEYNTLGSRNISLDKALNLLVTCFDIISWWSKGIFRNNEFPLLYSLNSSKKIVDIDVRVWANRRAAPICLQAYISLLFKNFKYSIPAEWVGENSKIMAFVNLGGDSKDILQAIQVHLVE